MGWTCKLPTGAPLMEICDQRRILIENHMGILEYGLDKIRVKVRFGYVVIRGESLRLVKMSWDRLVILGKILAVELRGSGPHGAI